MFVDTSSERYPVQLERGQAEFLATLIQTVGSSRVFVITDSGVRGLYAEVISAAFDQAGVRVEVLEVPAGESSKSISHAAILWDSLVSRGVTRADIVVAVGGGVVGDLAGFVAATIVRGVRWIQVPTTLLAMCDAAIGGKTGVNVAGGKNLVGSFHHPMAVLSWLGFQRTLSAREARSGLAEVVKSALIDGEESLRWLEDNAGALVSRDESALYEAVTLAARVKVEVVSLDPMEQGRRRVLNLGHTFGHALEHSVGYGTVTHGEAVSIGLCMAMALSRDLGYAAPQLPDRVAALLTQLELPTLAPSQTLLQWMTPLAHDKKAELDSVRFIVCRKPGDVFDERLSLVQIRKWLARQPCVSGSAGA